MKYSVHFIGGWIQVAAGLRKQTVLYGRRAVGGERAGPSGRELRVTEGGDKSRRAETFKHRDLWGYGRSYTDINQA
ncbi:MAG: hypothetical protein V1790_10505 [Planctomycetota bacterium]